MKLDCTLVPDLPRLAWLLEVRRGEDAAKVFHGPWVEARDDFVCDGAWDGPFEAGKIDDGRMSAAFGVQARDGELVISTPDHPYESLYGYDADDRMLFSPSMAFTLRRAGRSLSRSYIPHFARILYSLTSLDHHEWSLDLEGGGELLGYRMRNLHVAPDLTVRVERKLDTPAFKDFADYRDYLTSGLKRLAENAADPGRGRAYPTLATISSGYDSAAGAALSLEIGCEEAVTITSSRKLRATDTKDDLDDSGKAVGEAMGMRVYEYEREAYRAAGGFPEAEFVALGSLGQDVVIKNFEDRLAQRLVITGSHGDGVWTYNSKHPNVRDLVRPSTSESSMTEFRTRVGFFWVPVPCFGAVNYPDIRKITRSEEMQPWSVGGNYDRPIARRLVEERGVDRNLFGIRKRAITVLLNNRKNVEDQLTPASRESFRAFMKTMAGSRNRVEQFRFSLLYKINTIIATPISLANRVFKRLHLPIKIPNPIPVEYRQDPGVPSYLVHWGMEQIASRYAAVEPMDH